MNVRHKLMSAVLATMTWALVLGAAQEPPIPATGAQQTGGGGRGQRGGGGRGPNFPQQQRQPGDPQVIARGEGLYRVHCTACHGADLRGGDQGGPNLLRSQIVLSDQKGENILNVVRNGLQNPGMPVMPSFRLPDDDITAIAEYIHSVLARAGRQGRPPESETPIELNVLVGDPAAGQAYFVKACRSCHSPDGDFRGIASRIPDPRNLQNQWVAGGGAGRGGGGRGEGGETARNITVTVTTLGGQVVTGRLVRIDDFLVTLIQDNGVRRSFRREDAWPKVEVHDPLEPHRQLVLKLTDRDMHNVTAYLATLK